MRRDDTITFDRRRGRVTLEVTREAVSVVVARRGAAPERASFPYPTHGLGGHELIVSPDERYLAVFVYSGQSEQGYELFELRPALRACGRLPFVLGEGHAPCFSPDSAWIAMATERTRSFSADDRAAAPERDHVVDWAELRVQRLPDGPIHLCALRVIVPGDLPTCPFDFLYPERLRFRSPTKIALTMPWGGTATLPVPPPDLVVLDGPRAWPRRLRR